MTPTPANPWAAIDAAKSISHFTELALDPPNHLAVSQHAMSSHEIVDGKEYRIEHHGSNHTSGKACPECGFTGKSLADHSGEVAASIEGFTKRVSMVAALRAENGRPLSQENLERITTLKAHLEKLLAPEDLADADADRDRALRVHGSFLQSLKLEV